MKQLSVGGSVNGKVSAITSFGAFVDLGDGATGLIHVSKLSRAYVRDVRDVLSVGDEVEATVIAVNGAKIALSLIEREKEPPDFEKMLADFKQASGERQKQLDRGGKKRK